MGIPIPTATLDTSLFGICTRTNTYALNLHVHFEFNCLLNGVLGGAIALPEILTAPAPRVLTKLWEYICLLF